MDPREVATRYLAALSAGDPDAIAACVTYDFENEHTSALGSSSYGQLGYRDRLPGFLAQFVGLNYELVDTIAEGAQVAARYRLTAIHAGHPIEIPGVMLFVIEDELVAKRTDFWDSLTFLRQIGAITDAGFPTTQ
jgi:ketosteroid isomerase-like protein